MMSLANNVKIEGLDKQNLQGNLETSSNVASADVCSPPKRKKGQGVRIVGTRIYDSENGQTCHQCRQKTIGIVVVCKHMKGEKKCTHKYCHKCLLNRYGLYARDVAELLTWSCPKCLGSCNCSVCMKRKGQAPTGMLLHTAKAIGCGSVAEFLLKCPKITTDALTKSPGSQVSASSKPDAAQNSLCDEREDLKVNSIEGDNPNANGKSASSQGGARQKIKRENIEEKEEKGLEKIGVGKKGKLLNCEASDGLNNVKSEPFDDDQEVPFDLEVGGSKAKKRKLVVRIDGEVEGLSSSDINGKSNKPKIPIKREDFGLINKDESDNKDLQAKKKKKFPKVGINTDGKQRKVKVVIPELEIKLPQGERLACVCGIDLPSNAIGPALQFLEFCSAFQSVLNFKKGEAEALLRGLLRGSYLRWGSPSLAIQLHVKLLSLLEEASDKPCKISCRSSGKDSWIKVLCRHLNENSLIFKSREILEAPQLSPKICLMLNEDLVSIKEAIEAGAEAYEKLDLCKKLQLLNILCDDCLDTESMRAHIENAAENYREACKEKREEVVAARKEAREAYKKVKDHEIEKLRTLLESDATLAEKEALVSKVKEEIENKLQSVKSVALETTLKMSKKQRCDAVRTGVVLKAEDGRLFYRLRGASERDLIVCQDISNTEPLAMQDLWSVFSKEEEAILDNYLMLKRSQKHSNNTNSASEEDCSKLVSLCKVEFESEAI